MATQKLIYSTVTASTITLASLGSFACREGTIVTNVTNAYVDIAFGGKITVGAAEATGDCYLLLSSSDQTNISYPATGTDAAVSLPAQAITALDSLQLGQKVPGTELVFCCPIKTRSLPATTLVPIENIFVAQCFGGNIPSGGVGPVIVNCQGQAFDATGGHFAITWTGLTYSIA